MLNQHKLLTAAVVEPLLPGRFGRPYLWSESCPSTQDVLRDDALPEGAVALTEHQTAGRGRAGRQWQDERGTALLLSVLLRPPGSAAVAQLSLVCALAVAETVERATGLDAGVKWPNDVLVSREKVAGILLDGRDGAVVCGIGLNVNQTEPALPADARTPAASLRTLTGREHDRAAILLALLERLEASYNAWLGEGLALILPELERRDALRGAPLGVGKVSGLGAGIAPDGRLRVRTTEGTELLLSSGEVEVCRCPTEVGHQGTANGRAGSRSGP